jgi:hypothetical protein
MWIDNELILSFCKGLPLDQTKVHAGDRAKKGHAVKMSHLIFYLETIK